MKSEEILSEIHKLADDGCSFYEVSNLWSDYMAAIFKERLDKQVIWREVDE